MSSLAVVNPRRQRVRSRGAERASRRCLICWGLALEKLNHRGAEDRDHVGDRFRRAPVTASAAHRLRQSCTMPGMTYTIIDAASITPAPGPHPAASQYDKGVGEALGVRAFGIYQVELPPGAETVRHDHLKDGAEDVYAVIKGTGTVVVAGREIPVGPGQFIAVTPSPRGTFAPAMADSSLSPCARHLLDLLSRRFVSGRERRDNQST